MMKKLSVLLLTALLLAALCLTPAMAAAGNAEARPSSQSLYIDSSQKTVGMYNIDGSNYVKLRDIAYLLNGTSAQVYIDYADGTADIRTGAPYTKPDGSEMRQIGTAVKTAAPTSTKLVVDGKPVSGVAVYLIDGNNWLKMRDLGQTLSFGVAYESGTNRVLINTERLGSVLMGDTAQQVSSKLGAATRELTAASGAIYGFYGGYDNYNILRFESGYAVFQFTNTADGAKAPCTIYTDSYGGRVWGASVGRVIAEDAAVTEQLVFELTNAFRAENGRAALSWNASLANAAKAHSADMAAKNYFSHTSLDGTTFDARIKNAGYSFTSCGENIIAGYASAFDSVNGWVNSEGHRSNMLGAYKDLGVGWAFVSTGYRNYGTQDFGGR